MNPINCIFCIWVPPARHHWEKVVNHAERHCNNSWLSALIGPPLYMQIPLSLLSALFSVLHKLDLLIVNFIYFFQISSFSSIFLHTIRRQWTTLLFTLQNPNQTKRHQLENLQSLVFALTGPSAFAFILFSFLLFNREEIPLPFKSNPNTFFY